jgi:hypothetical protein
VPALPVVEDLEVVEQRQLVLCTERRARVIDFWIALANAIIIARRLLRRAWTNYRWDTRPGRRP